MMIVTLIYVTVLSLLLLTIYWVVLWRSKKLGTVVQKNIVAGGDVAGGNIIKVSDISDGDSFSKVTIDDRTLVTRGNLRVVDNDVYIDGKFAGKFSELAEKVES